MATAEAEAAEILLRITGTGINELIRVSGAALTGGGRGALLLISYIYAMKAQGSPKEIAKDGLAIVTIPKDKYDDFCKALKGYKEVKHFKVDHKNYDEGFVDICMSPKDVGTVSRVLDLIGVSAVIQTMNAKSLGESDANGMAVRNAENFAQAAENLKQYALKSDEAFNRTTDKDFARDEPYIMCDRLNPQNYIQVLPKKDEFKGEAYTRSFYSVCKDGKEVMSCDDGRYEGKTAADWINMRNEMIKKSGMNEEDIVYFKNVHDHTAYCSLADGKSPEKIIEADSLAENLKMEMYKELKRADAIVPADAPAASGHRIEESGSGQKNISKESTKNKKSPQKTSPTAMTSEEKWEDRAATMKAASQDFEASLNRRTGKDFARDEPYYIAQRLNPDKYIELSPKEATFEGEKYTKTTYTVYDGDRQLGKYDDGRFPGRDKYFWGQLKDKLRSCGGFQNDMVYFPDKDALDEYRNLYHEAFGKENPVNINRDFLKDVSGKEEKAKPNFTPGGVKEFAAEFKAEKAAEEMGNVSALVSEKLAAMKKGK